MPAVACPNCSRTLSVPENAVGKKVRCKACQEIFQLDDEGVQQTIAERPLTSPGQDSASAFAGGASAGAGSGPPDQWYAKTGSGDQYGPASREELDRWVAEGRVTADFQVLRPGSDQWQWADEVFPHLVRPMAQQPAYVGQSGGGQYGQAPSGYGTTGLPATIPAGGSYYADHSGYPAGGQGYPAGGQGYPAGGQGYPAGGQGYAANYAGGYPGAYPGGYPTHYPGGLGGVVCPYCQDPGPPIYQEQISSAGWVTFAILLIFFWPLFWIGLLIKETRRVCRRCYRQF